MRNKPTLKEVKKHFKDAKKIESIYTKATSFELDLNKGVYDMEDINGYSKNGITYALWSPEHGYAKILSYKTPKFQITKETILKYKMKDEFPDVFDEPFTGWCKTTGNGNEKWMGFFKNDIFKYGIGADGKWFENKSGYNNFKINNSYYEATPQEVETALICEAKKRYPIGTHINCLHYTEYGKIDGAKFELMDNCIRHRNKQGYICCVYQEGKFATIIETITIKEAEKLLKDQGINKKIVGL